MGPSNLNERGYFIVILHVTSFFQLDILIMYYLHPPLSLPSHLVQALPPLLPSYTIIDNPYTRIESPPLLFRVLLFLSSKLYTKKRKASVACSQLNTEKHNEEKKKMHA